MLTQYAGLIKLTLIAALVIGAVWAFNAFVNRQQAIGYDRAVAEYNVKLLEAKAEADKLTAAFRDKLKEAQDGQAQRDQTIRATAAAAATASTGLRNALDTIRSGVPSASADALRHATATLTTVLGDCQGKYRGMAEVADRHASDTRTLIEAWPK